MACSGSIVHRILGLPGFFFPLVDIPMLFLGDDVFPFFVVILIYDEICSSAEKLITLESL
jgi:hypothetical protein